MSMPGAVCAVMASALSSSSGCLSLASPKSRILMWPPSVMNKFSGLRSRCTIPFAWAAAKSLGDLHPIIQRLADRQGTSCDLVAQSFAFKELRDDVGIFSRRTDVVHDKDVGMVQ